MNVLLMRLTGPMQAWGTQSRFSVRDTGLEPSKSGVIGLLCAAMGKPRRETPGDGFPTLQELAEGTSMAVRVDRPGTMLPDYHTAQDVVKASSEPGKRPNLKDCEPSTRYYLADADFLVAIGGPEGLLVRLDAALASPVWPLFLGRKAFVPSMPVRIEAGLVEDTSLQDILKTQPWWKRHSREPDPQPLRITVEVGNADGEVRNDVPLDFRSPTRRFTVRHVRDVEMWDIAQEAPELIQEWPPCTSRN